MADRPFQPLPPQAPPGAPSPSAFRLAPRTPTLASRIALPVVDEGPGYVRFRPFNDARVILLLRGQPPREGIPPGVTPFWSLVATAPVGPFVVEVLRNKLVLSPPPWQPGMPPVDPQDYEPVDDVLLLPDGELRIPRAPRGFSDGEIAFIVQSIQLFSAMPGGAPDPAHRDYLPAGPAPFAPAGAAVDPRPIMPAQPAPPPGGASSPGVAPPPGSALQGCDVVLQANTFNMPPRCASCGAPKETTLNTARTQSRAFRGKATRTFAIPYCNPCAARVKGARSKGLKLGLATFGIALATAALSFVAPGLPGVVLVAAPLLVSVGFAIAVMTRLAPPAPAPPAVGTGDAVRLVSFKGERSVLYCANPTWAQAFAQANNVSPVPKSRSSRFGVGSLWTAILVAPAAALGAWFTSHPELHIDNAGVEPLQIWVDGDPSVVVPPNPGGVVPPSIYVAYGQHMLGYSKTGAGHAEGAGEVHVTMRDDFLYNPGKTACYWLVADSYGSAAIKGVAQGPQPVLEFYSFDKVDTWFGDNPQSVSVSSGQSGDTRVAVQRAKACMELAADGCDEVARSAFVHCEQGATSDAAFAQCERAVSCGSKAGQGESNGEPPEPSPSAPAPGPAHTTHASPEPKPGPPRPAHSSHPVAPAASGSAKHG
jgi:hypothetical protein